MIREKGERARQIEFPERKGRDEFALLMGQGSCSVSVPTWQSGHCTYKVRIIFCKIKLGAGKYLSLILFSELTETRFGAQGSILLQARSPLRVCVTAPAGAADSFLV